jgi:hypothetical protein
LRAAREVTDDARPVAAERARWGERCIFAAAELESQ